MVVDRSSAARSLLDALPWAGDLHVRLLGFDVALRTTEPEVADYLATLYAPMLVDGAHAEHTLTLAALPGRRGREYAVDLDGARVLRHPAPSVAFAQLVYEANRQVIEHTVDAVLVHAGAVVHDGRAVLVPGPMGSGKSTLVAALVARGAAYLTDELAAIDPERSTVAPYPKFISLAPVTSDVLTALDPPVPTAIARWVGDHRLVPPRAIRPDAVGGAAPVRLVVTPRYERGAAVDVERLRPAEALLALAEHTYHLDRDGDRVLRALGRVVETVPCYRLVSGDLDAACAAVEGLLATATAGVGR